MRLWIATGVLCDYTCGMVVIYAKNEKDALATLVKREPFTLWRLMGTPSCECHRNTKGSVDKVWAKYHAPTCLPEIFKEIRGNHIESVSGGG